MTETIRGDQQLAVKELYALLRNMLVRKESDQLHRL
jgi:hypothetical protein